MSKKLILAVIDGLTPAALEVALEAGRTPALSLFASNGSLRPGSVDLPLADSGVHELDRHRRPP